MSEPRASSKGLPPVQTLCWGWTSQGVHMVKLVNQAGADERPRHQWYDLEAQAYLPVHGPQRVTQWQAVERPGQAPQSEAAAEEPEGEAVEA